MATKTAAPVARPSTEGTPSTDADGAGKGKGRKRLMVLVLVLLVGLAAAAYVVLRPGSAEAGSEKPVAGAVLKLDPINVNLAEGHYLKLGLALQLTEAVVEPPDGSQALDLAIDTFSNRAMGDLGSNEARTLVKAELLKRISTAYDGAVMDLYFTEFVMQ